MGIESEKYGAIDTTIKPVIITDYYYHYYYYYSNIETRASRLSTIHTININIMTSH